MKCRDFNARVQELLDRHDRLTGDALLLEHTAECPGCAAELDAYRELFERLEHFRPPELGEEFSRHVVSLAFPATPSASESCGRGSQMRLIGSAVLACLLLIGAFPLLWFMAASSERVESADVAPASSPPRDYARIAESPDRLQVDSIPPDIPEDSAETATALVTDEDWRVLWDGWSHRLATNRLERFDALSLGIKPIATSLTTALDGLRMTFPIRGDQPVDGSSEDSAASSQERWQSLMG